MNPFSRIFLVSFFLSARQMENACCMVLELNWIPNEVLWLRIGIRSEVISAAINRVNRNFEPPIEHHLATHR